MLDKFTTRTEVFFTRGKKVLVTSIIPHRLTSAERLKTSMGVHSMGQRERIPALFTSPHNPAKEKNEISLKYEDQPPLQTQQPHIVTSWAYL